MYIEKTLAKFNKDKTYAYFPGNTIIHFIDDPEQISLLSAISNEMSKNALFEKYVLLPASSYHMTVCDILTYVDLFANPVFANFAHKDARSIADIDRLVLEDLGKSVFDLNVKMTPVAIKPKRVQLQPKTEEDAEKLRVFREAVSKKIGFALNPNYTFHISLSYQLQELNDSEKAEMDEFMEQLNEKYLSSFGDVNVNLAHFTLFNDMSAFGLYHEGREKLGKAAITYLAI